MAEVPPIILPLVAEPGETLLGLARRVIERADAEGYDLLSLATFAYLHPGQSDAWAIQLIAAHLLLKG